MVIDGDLVFEKGVVERLLGEERENILITRAVESANINDRGSKIISNIDGKVIVSKNNLLSHELFSGMFKLGVNASDRLRTIVSKETYWDQEMAYPLHELSQHCHLYSLCLNTRPSIVPPDSYRGDASWEGEPRRIQKKGNTIIKTADKGKQKLINEVHWILKLPPELKNYFPEITGYDLEHHPVYYEMKYYPHPTLKTLLLNQAINLEKARDILENILDFMFSQVYSRKRLTPPPGYIRYCYLRKARARVQASRSKSRTFDSLTEVPNLVINGHEMTNLATLFDQISLDAKFLGKLEPPFLCLTHGDFKLDNMLIDLATGNFILIDPRGKSPIGLDVDDPISDLAKLFTSCHGFYDLLHEDLFTLTIKKQRSTMDIQIEFGSPQVQANFEKLTSWLLELLSKYPEIADEDKNWQRRLFFTESMLMIANAPFHLTTDPGSERLAMGLYVRGIQLLNQFLNSYPLTKERSYFMVNVNTLVDYQAARCVSPTFTEMNHRTVGELEKTSSMLNQEVNLSFQAMA